jgi:hypothetical protein
MICNFRRVILTAVPFAAAFMVRFVAHDDIIRGALISVPGGLAFGLLMEFVWARRQASLIDEGIPAGDYAVRPEFLLRIETRDRRAVFDAVAAAASHLTDNVSVLNADETNGSFVAQTGWTSHGRGEFISAEVRPEGVEISVCLRSRPKGDTTRIDFGRNYRHLEIVRRHLVEVFGDSNVTLVRVVDTDKNGAT